MSVRRTSATSGPASIKLHFLEKSRAQRVVWLLEALRIKYEIVPYKRDANFRAPESLRKIHPLGRSPLLEIESLGGTSTSTVSSKPAKHSKVIAESGHIFQYILENYDNGDVLSNPEDKEQINYYLHYAEGSLQPPLLIEFVLSKVRQTYAPFPLSSFKNYLANKISEKYSGGETESQLSFLDGEVQKNGGYFVNGKLSAADLILSFPLDMAFQRDFATRDKYPNLAKWLDNIKTDEGYQKAQSIEKEYDEKLAKQQS